MTCSEASTLRNGYLAHELNAAQAAEFIEHVRGCDDCSLDELIH
jgi:hypothetical protein